MPTSNVANAVVRHQRGLPPITGRHPRLSNGSGITLSASDGRNISATFTAGAGAITPSGRGLRHGHHTGATAVVTTSTVDVNYVDPSGVSGSLSLRRRRPRQHRRRDRLHRQRSLDG